MRLTKISLLLVVSFLFLGDQLILLRNLPQWSEVNLNIPRGVVTPDMFKRLSDGDDDAPSINRAIHFLKKAKQTKLTFLSRRYVLRTAVLQQDSVIAWIGQGWSEPQSLISRFEELGPGTWLVIDQLSDDAVTISGPGSRGSSFRHIGVFERQPQPVAGAAWIPKAYRYAFSVEDTRGTVIFDDIFLFDVTLGIRAHASGRLSVNSLRGQVFDNALYLDKSYDSSEITAFHVWPYWSQADSVLSYTQAHFDAIWLERADTSFIDRIFVFGAHSGIRLGQSQNESNAVIGGPATKNTIGSIQCDFTQWCLWITGSGVTVQASSLSSQGQEYDRSRPPAPISDASAIRIDGQAVMQIGQVWQDFMDHDTVTFNNATEASNVEVGSLYEDFRFALRPLSHVNMVSISGAQHIFSVALPPMTIALPGETIAPSNANTNGLVRIP